MALSDENVMDKMLLTVHLTHEEAGSVYAVMQAVLSLGVFDSPKVILMQSVVEKLKAAQTTAITEASIAESAKGEPN